MIREMGLADLEEVLDIWLDANKKAHDFIEESYWEKNREKVRRMLPQARVSVFLADSGEILGFLGLAGDYIAGIFVREGARSQGIGRALLNHAKKTLKQLTLHVYQKNKGAVRFYQREGFRAEAEEVDGQTGEKEWLMRWEKEDSASPVFWESE